MGKLTYQIAGLTLTEILQARRLHSRALVSPSLRAWFLLKVGEIMTEITKEFTMRKRDGSEAKFSFAQPEGSVWYWDLPDGERSLPLPEVDLSSAKSLKKCLDLIGKARGIKWVGQVVADILKC